MRTKVRTHQKRFTFFLLNREFPPPCPPRHGFGMLTPFPESSAASALPMSLFRPRMLLSVALIGLLAGCGGDPVRPTPPPAPTVVPQAKPIRIGIALGGGAAKGFAHIGVIKMLEANGFEPAVVSGTSAGSVVGALYASGMDAFQMQSKAVALDEASIRDVRLFSGGLVQGQKLQDYVNEQVAKSEAKRAQLQGLEGEAFAINRIAGELAREAADGCVPAGRPL